MTNEQWLGYHALDGENEEWTHVEVWEKDNKFYWNYFDWNYFDEYSQETGPNNGPFASAWDAYNDAVN
jgi:hypothetical protein